MSKNTTENSNYTHSALLGFLLGSISLITVVMNILVLCAVKTEKKLQTVSNLYIVSLSIADLIVGAAVMPLNIVYLLNSVWTLGLTACLFWLSMDYVASTASIFSLFILCLDRYRSVQQPLKYLQYRTKMRASLMILGAWFLSSLWVIPILGWHDSANDEKWKGKANCETKFSDVTWFKVLTAIVNFYLPSIIMLWLYCKIFRTVRKHCQQREVVNGSHCSSYESKSVSHGKTKDKQNICLQKQMSHENTSPEDEQMSSEPKNMAAKLHFRNSDKTTKAFVSRSNSKAFKCSCLPLTTAQSEPDLDTSGKKSMCVKKDNKNEEDPHSQESDLSAASDSDTFTENTPSGEQSNPNPDRACSPQENTENRDSRGLTYLRKTWQNLHTHSKSHLQRLHVSREWKAAKQLGVIMATFMLCWIPYFVLYTVTVFQNSEQFYKLRMFTIWLGYVNSTLNPFLYPLCNENFKKTFKKILHIQ
ncbi:histamine H1 receptor [Numida meleagris]|uniref:histamine H1 receptor n=1 Tax=Numida meleagris TaxID=8996 RepID=UPI000B3E1102|nr:histamine H1 receptor [Numida meleagris]